MSSANALRDVMRILEARARCLRGTFYEGEEFEHTPADARAALEQLRPLCEIEVAYDIQAPPDKEELRLWACSIRQELKANQGRMHGMVYRMLCELLEHALICED